MKSILHVILGISLVGSVGCAEQPGKKKEEKTDDAKAADAKAADGKAADGKAKTNVESKAVPQ